MSFCERTVALIGQENFDRLASKNIIVFGCGGVGGYVIEMLARTGIGSLCLVDFDAVAESNINRQIIALYDTVGQYKTECFAKRIEKINKSCKVQTFNEKLSAENIDKFDLKQFDYVVDCIDDVKAKVELIKYCEKNKIKLISSMGAGNRFDMPNFVVGDIFDTKNDGLAKAVRTRLKKEGIKKAKVAWTASLPNKVDDDSSVVGSIAYYPAMCGITIASYVINELIKQK